MYPYVSWWPIVWTTKDLVIIITIKLKYLKRKKCIFGFLDCTFKRLGPWYSKPYFKVIPEWTYDHCLYWIRHGDSKRWQGMKRGLRPNGYQNLHYPPSPWKVVPHHWGLCLLLITNSGVGYFTSHKNRTKSCGTRPMVLRPYPRGVECQNI